MVFARVTSPHAHAKANTASVMQLVLIATTPGLLCLTYFFGFGLWVNIALCAATALACEAAVVKLRNRPLGFYLNDYSVLVTALLLAIALPPYAPWWIPVVGTAFGVVVGKHLYGGLGYNPFNPAMLAYVVLLVSFPLQMTTWGAPTDTLPDQANVPNLLDAIRINFGIFNSQIDAVTMATPLDLFKNNVSLTTEDLRFENPQFGNWGGRGWEFVNLAFLLGGCYLLYNKVFTWHGPVGMLLGLTVLSIMFYDSGSSECGGSPLLHLLSGATMLGAFFIVTDPVTTCSSNFGRFYYGLLVGSLVYIIRAWGNYPDAVAFAVLLGNFCAPLIDHYVQPRTYGHKQERD